MKRLGLWLSGILAVAVSLVAIFTYFQSAILGAAQVEPRVKIVGSPATLAVSVSPVFQTHLDGPNIDDFFGDVSM